MNISAISNQSTNFSGYAPIKKVLFCCPNGQEFPIGYQEVKGVIYSLVSRLNKFSTSRESTFFRENIPIFRNYPHVSSTSLGSLGRKLVFGERDISILRGLCNDVYHKGENTIEEINKEVYEKILKPFTNKLRKRRFIGDNTGEPVAFTIHANKIKQKGSLKYDFGIDMTDTTGKKVFAVLPSTIPMVAQNQPKVNFQPMLF